MAMNDLFQAFQMFQQGVNQYAVSSGIQEATKVVDQLNQDTTLTLAQRAQTQNQLANQLQAQMAAAGAPNSQIQAAVTAIAPPQIQNSQQAYAAAQRASNPADAQEYLKQAKDMQAFESAPAVENREDTQEFTASQAQIARDADLYRTQLAKTLETAKVNPNERAFKALPEENQRQISKLADKTADKISIANQINAAMTNWDTLSEKARLQQGRQLIKVLNSTQGQDAVGSEEAKRLAGKLEFAFSNITNDNPLQFGRDLEGFKADALNTLKNIRDGAAADKAEIDRLYGRAPVVQAAAPVQSTQSDAYAQTRQKAIEWGRANPNDPRTMALRKKYGF